jgi:hypothetical protein
MKFIREAFRLINDPDGLLNILGFVMLIVSVLVIIIFSLAGYGLFKILMLICENYEITLY